MDNSDLEIRKVVEAAVTSSIDIGSVSSLRDLYTNKKNKLNISDRQIQKMLGMDANTLNPILDGVSKQVNFINILKLAHFLGLSVNDLIKVYVPQMDAKLIGEIQRARDSGYIIEYFDVAVLTKMKFFKSGMSAKEMSDRITLFFNLKNLYGYSEDNSFPMFSRTKRDSSELMRMFWVKSAFSQFELINNVNPYDRTMLKNIIPRIKPYTRDVKNGLLKVARALFNVGVTVIFQPSLEKIQVRGATMSVNGKPCIVLSDLQKKYPTLWFTLLHELYHVLFDFDEIQQQSYHLSNNDGDLFLMNEERADDFATAYFLDESRFNFVSGYITSHNMVERLAREWGLHSSIIYAIYCYKTKEWPRYNQFIPDMKEALSVLNTHPFDRESLRESVEEIKKLIYC